MCDIIKELRIRNVTYWTGYRPICELHTAFYLLKILFLLAVSTSGGTLRGGSGFVILDKRWLQFWKEL